MTGAEKECGIDPHWSPPRRVMSRKLREKEISRGTLPPWAVELLGTGKCWIWA